LNSNPKFVRFSSRNFCDLAKNSDKLWTDEELSSAVEAYVFMLRAERFGLFQLKDSNAQLLLARHLNIRNEGSIRYRMRNISAVVREMGAPTVSVYSPAERVGSNVRIRIRAILTANQGFQEILQPNSSTSVPSSTSPSTELKSDALNRLSYLRVKISELERELVGIGHNRPPEPLNADAPDRAAFENARQDISALEEEIRRVVPNPDIAERHISRLLAFGLNVALWAGERVTKFTDASLKLLAPVAVAQATGLAPILLDALRAVVRAISH
jgi:hypothetical protein